VVAQEVGKRKNEAADDECPERSLRFVFHVCFDVRGMRVGLSGIK